MKNAYLLLRFTQSAKTEIKIAILTVLIILCLPVMAVFALGASTLSFLSGGGGTTTAISTQTVGLYEGQPSSSDTYALSLIHISLTRMALSIFCHKLASTTQPKTEYLQFRAKVIQK